MTVVLHTDQPPSAHHLEVPNFFIGRNSRGQWVVQDERHVCGGLFKSRADALRYAMFETGRQPQAVIMVPETLELDMSASFGLSPCSQSAQA